MTVSELIAELQIMFTENGDLPVYITDSEYPSEELSDAPVVCNESTDTPGSYYWRPKRVEI
jgi:hypothetical protein